MNDLLQVLLYFFGPLGEELPGFPCKITDLKNMDFLASLAVFEKLFSGLHYPEGLELGNKAILLQQPEGFRIYSEDEILKISKRCRALLQHLEQVKLIDAEQREDIINKIMELPNAEISLSRVKWLIYSIFAERDDKTGAAYIEKSIFNPENERLH